MQTSKGDPVKAQRSGFDGGRRRREANELLPEAEAKDTELASTMRGYSSAGRTPALQAGGHRFESDYLHQDGPIAQLARAHD